MTGIEELQQAFESAKGEIGKLERERRELAIEFEEFKRKTVDEALRRATDNDWCGEVENCLTDLGLGEYLDNRSQLVEVIVKLSYKVRGAQHVRANERRCLTQGFADACLASALDWDLSADGLADPFDRDIQVIGEPNIESIEVSGVSAPVTPSL